MHGEVGEFRGIGNSFLFEGKEIIFHFDYQTIKKYVLFIFKISENKLENS